MIRRGISFGEQHSYYQFDLILSSVTIPPAKPKTLYYDIPGADGSVDMTETVGGIRFYDRECKFVFTMNPAGKLTDTAFEEKKTEVSNAINGRQCKITLDKDPNYYYLGRCTVDEFLSDKRIRQIVVKAKVAPYKMKQHETIAVFSPTAEPLTIYIQNARKTVSPEIECTEDGCSIVWNGASYPLASGTQKFLDIQFVEGVNKMQISGSGTVTFRYHEGDL